ncbi:hypothetical protein [Agrococcus baldri]|uniref:YdhG-like domain-containing protein n=1 Tax=Agrococcus baldri TaxID=153730 RepID=A0AA87UQT2_9MICO|nr:hypothetical protein [Agrococcus baldri]GEK79366.1 hypothetical protein ABA31_07170 [Agrococcus baldri]
MASDLDAVEARLWAALDRYRPELVDGTIYGMPSLLLPGATGHDYFAAVRRGQKKIGLSLIIADRWPEDVERASVELRRCRTGKATWSFTELDEAVADELEALLDRLMVRYRIERSA